MECGILYVVNFTVIIEFLIPGLKSVPGLKEIKNMLKEYSPLLVSFVLTIAVKGISC